jgi:hypothetical protein
MELVWLTVMVLGAIAFLGAGVMAFYLDHKSGKSSAIGWFVGIPAVGVGGVALGFLFSPLLGGFMLLPAAIIGIVYIVFIVALDCALIAELRKTRMARRTKRAVDDPGWWLKG